MDVQAAANAAPPTPAPASIPPPPTVPAPAVAVGNLPAPPAAPGSPSGAQPATTATATAAPVQRADVSRNGTPQTPGNDETLKPVVAKLFNAAAQNVEISFQVLKDPNEIVTVFTDKSTGQEIIQFPSQTLIALAQMYNKISGNVLDQNV